MQVWVMLDRVPNGWQHKANISPVNNQGWEDAIYQVGDRFVVVRDLGGCLICHILQPIKLDCPA